MSLKNFLIQKLNEDDGIPRPPTESEKGSMQALFNTWRNIGRGLADDHMPLDIVETVVRYLEDCGYIKGE